MNLVNVAIENLGAKIKTFSSFIDDLYQPANILKPNDNSLWTTSQGLPQFVIISLENLNVNFRSINEIKFLLWHDYDTNPKTIELWVAQTTNQEFVFWTQFFLNQKKGIQLFQIQPLPSRFIYLKISITETYGAFQTYLNQVFLMAEQVTPMKKSLAKKDILVKKKKQLDLEDLQSGLNQLIEMERKMSRTKSKSNFKDKSQKVLNKNIWQSGLFSPDMIKRYKNGNQQNKVSLSKGLLSSNRGGLQIYYHQSQNKEDEQYREYVSNNYDSSSSNQISRGLQMRRVKENEHFLHDSEGFSNLGNSKSRGYNHLSNLNSSSKKSYPVLSGHKKLSLGNESQKYFKQDKNFPSTHYDERIMTLNENEQEQEVEEEQQYNSKEEEMVEEQQSEGVQEEQLRNVVISNSKNYKQIQLKNREKYRQSQSQISEQQQEKSYNAALLALSENVMKLEDNMEAIQRRVEVLDMKVLHSHQKIQKQLFEKIQTKVQQIVERKLKRIYSVKNGFKNIEENLLVSKNKELIKKKIFQEQEKKQQKLRNFESKEQKFNYKKNLTRQFFKSEYQQGEQNDIKQRDKTKSKRRVRENVERASNDHHEGQGVSDIHNRLKTNKSFTRIAAKGVNPIKQPHKMTSKQDAQITKRLQDRQHLAKLLEKLSVKLKERQAKLSKMQHKQKQMDPTRVLSTDHQGSKINRNYYKKNVPSNLLQ